MFSTLTQKLLLGLYIFILLSIPVGAYLASQHQTVKSSALEPTPAKLPVVKTTPLPTSPTTKQLLNASKSNANPSEQPSPTPQSPTIATSFGPTMSLKIYLQGRPANNQATKLFVGIMEGSLTQNPKFLLNFTVDIPSNGAYDNLSLAGLTPGNNYTALLKGSAQIATASAFTMSPNITSLNKGQPINLLSGDLNDDNIVNSADYSIAQKALGATSSSTSWNANADLNKDGIINIFDLAIIGSNLGKVGASGTWTSPIPKSATPSASLSENAPIGGPEGSTNGHWIWIPGSLTP